MYIQEIPFGSPFYMLGRQLREQVLRLPLGLVLTEQDTEGEDKQFHIAALDADGSVKGTIILKPLSAVRMEIRGVAVSPSLQGSGLGRKLLEFAENYAIEQGATAIVMDARVAVQGFYEKLGYRTAGEAFIKSTIAHIKMEKAIDFALQLP